MSTVIQSVYTMSDKGVKDPKAIEKAIGKLLLCAGSNEIAKRVISVFDHSASRSVNLKSLRAFKLNMLEPCAEFLNIELADAEENKIYTQNSLADRILFEICALLPSECAECKEIYTIEFKNERKPVFHCHECFRGSHDCASVTAFHEVLSSACADVARPSGFIWLCKSCKVSSSPIVPRKKAAKHESVSRSDAALSVIKGHGSQTSSKVSSRGEVADDSSSGDFVNSNRSEIRRKLSKVLKERICQKYKMGKCPHGLKGNKELNGQVCEFEHPKYCLKFCRYGTQRKFGCTKGSECKFFHPVLCKFSVKSKLCTNQECTFIHLKGTRRKEGDTARGTKGKKTQRATGRNESVPAEIPPDHFLELKRLVDSMQSSIDSIVRRFDSQPMPYHAQLHYPRVPLPPGTPHPQYPQFPLAQSTLNMSNIPHVSC